MLARQRVRGPRAGNSTPLSITLYRLACPKVRKAPQKYLCPYPDGNKTEYVRQAECSPKCIFGLSNIQHVCAFFTDPCRGGSGGMGAERLPSWSKCVHAPRLSCGPSGPREGGADRPRGCPEAGHRPEFRSGPVSLRHLLASEPHGGASAFKTFPRPLPFFAFHPGCLIF